MVSSVAQHPLDPLSAAEIKAAAACVRAFRQTPDTVRFNSISLQVIGSRFRSQWSMCKMLQIGRSAECLAASIAMDVQHVEQSATQQQGLLCTLALASAQHPAGVCVLTPTPETGACLTTNTTVLSLW